MFKVLGAIWVGVFVYSFLSLFWGGAGIIAYRQTLADRDRMLKNHHELLRTHEYLDRISKSLYETETIAVDARGLSYGKTGEKYVRIEGLGAASNPYTKTGEVFYASTPHFLPDMNIKYIAFFAGVVFLFLSTVFGTGSPRRRVKNAGKYTPGLAG
ncbi:MAG: hypothetical protein LBD48_00405 [Treponema sp.]|jgi:hypothetical protein|nr:hypothetical protein [Treponema sp.]